MEYLRRLILILNTELSAKNKIQVTGSLAVPVLIGTKKNYENLTEKQQSCMAVVAVVVVMIMINKVSQSSVF
jgi:hypothetical protein